jgi:regulator of protease activity HflC (stomatin/prohibitin superfamily)
MKRGASGGTGNTLSELRSEHAGRELRRLKIRVPIIIATVAIAAAGLAPGVFLAAVFARHWALLVAGIVAAALSVLWYLSAQLLAEWDRAVILHMGRFHKVAGPGFFMIVPILQHVSRVVDTRVRTTSFYVESMLTKDTVPVSIEAIAFWRVSDAQKTVLEVEDYYQAITMAVQTAHRDIIGEHMLSDILAKREEIVLQLKKILDVKARAWGISVDSIEIRDITIPADLQHALSKQAQAERERQARTILGEAEMEIAEKFAEAAEAYRDNPVALQLRAMNIIYEGLRSGTSMMLVPSQVLDTMNLGSLAAMGIAQQQAMTDPQAAKKPV